MTNPVKPIKIEGLREFQRALKEVDGESQKQLRVVLNQVAETVAQGAARRVPRKSGRAAASLRTASSQREARVQGGGARVPYYGWLDFGGTRTGRAGGRSYRPFVKSGRYMYPTIAANTDTLAKALSDALARVARDAGLEVTDG